MGWSSRRQLQRFIAQWYSTYFAHRRSSWVQPQHLRLKVLRQTNYLRSSFCTICPPKQPIKPHTKAQKPCHCTLSRRRIPASFLGLGRNPIECETWVFVQSKWMPIVSPTDAPPEHPGPACFRQAQGWVSSAACQPKLEQGYPRPPLCTDLEQSLVVCPNGRSICSQQIGEGKPLSAVTTIF